MKYLRHKLRFISFAVILLAFPLAIYLLLQETNLLGLARGTPANLVIDTSASYSRSSYVWKNLAQGGEQNTAKGPMLNSVVEEIKVLDPQYIRLDHIYDFYDVVGRSPNGDLIFNWTQLDLTIQDIMVTGARPFLSLSYTPSVISNGSEIDRPVNWLEWQLIVQKTIEHYSGTAGMGIADVYYEVWNEPDLFGGWKMYGDKNYLDLYYYSALGAQNARNVLSYKLGGPATTALYENWFGNFLKFVNENGLRLDFYSWHTYSLDLDKFEKDLKTAQGWLAANSTPARFRNLELVISEAGPDSEVNRVYDQPFAAIHTLAMSAALDGKIDRVFNFEIKDGEGPSKYWGRWGLLTNEKFGKPETKPRYQALQFLNQMDGNRVNVIGQGSWVKAFGSKTPTGLKILVVNYDPTGKHSESVPLNFLNLQSNSFIYKRTNFLGESTQRRVSTNQTKWATVEYFAPNSAAIIELIY